MLPDNHSVGVNSPIVTCHMNKPNTHENISFTLRIYPMLVCMIDFLSTSFCAVHPQVSKSEYNIELSTVGLQIIRDIKK